MDKTRLNGMIPKSWG